MSPKRFLQKLGRADAPGERSSDAEVALLRDENQQLRRAVEELSILNDLSRAIGASVDSQDIIRKIVDRSMRAVQAEQTVVTLVDRDANQPMRTLVRAMTSSSEHPHYHVNENLLGWMHLYKRPLLTNDPKNDERFRGHVAQTHRQPIAPQRDEIVVVAPDHLRRNGVRRDVVARYRRRALGQQIELDLRGQPHLFAYGRVGFLLLVQARVFDDLRGLPGDDGQQALILGPEAARLLLVV